MLINFCHRRALAAAIFAGACASVTADDAVTLEPVTVTASRVAPHTAPDVTRITRSEIEEIAPADLPSLLRSVAGVLVASPAGRAGPDEVFLRGAEPNFTVVLIDGIQVNDSTNTRGGSFDFGQVDVDEIERIEIVRGARSAVHGSDAMAGLISITTRSGAPGAVGGRAGLDVGADGWRRASAAHSLSVGRAKIAVQAGATDDGDVVPQADFRSRYVAAGMDWSDGERWNVGATLRANDVEASSFPEDSGGPRLAALPLRQTDSGQSFGVGIDAGLRINPAWTVLSETRWYRTDAVSDSPGVLPGIRDGVPPNGSDSEFERASQLVSALWSGPAATRLAFGGEIEREAGDSLGYVDFGFRIPNDFSLDRTTRSLFVEGYGEVGDVLQLSAGTRHDRTSETGGNTSSSAEVAWLLDAETTVSARYAEGYKLPSFFALASPLVGNPDLRPERSRTLELAATGNAAENARWTIRAYRSRYRDLVDFDPELFTNVNRSRVIIQGGEAEISAQFGARWNVSTALAYTDIDLVDGGRLRRRPAWSGNVTVSFRPNESWTFTTLVDSQTQTFDSSIPTGALELDGWTRVDFSARWSWRPDWRVTFAVDNLLDESYEPAIGFAAAGIQPRLGVSRIW